MEALAEVIVGEDSASMYDEDDSFLGVAGGCTEAIYI